MGTRKLREQWASYVSDKLKNDLGIHESVSRQSYTASVKIFHQKMNIQNALYAQDKTRCWTAQFGRIFPVFCKPVTLSRYLSERHIAAYATRETLVKYRMKKR